MKRLFRGCAALALMILPAAVPAQMTGDQLSRLRAIDARMGGIAYRLTTANVALCTDRQPATGLTLHVIDQYDAADRAAAKAVFGFVAPVSVEAVVADGPAARAGIRADDGVVAVAGAALPIATTGAPTSATRDAAVARLAAQPVAVPIDVTIRRDGRDRGVALSPVAACRSAFEVLLEPGMKASSDGIIVQVGVRFFERYDDAEVAVVVAHELAHTILRHRVRLDAAGISRGLLAEVGRNARLIRTVETDADRLSVWLLRNAGYDPKTAPRFWIAHGGDVDGGLFRSRTHPSSAARARALEAEIATMPVAVDPTYLPPILATRDVALK